MSSTSTPDEPSEPATNAPGALRGGSPGLSGQGADSALARLRELEQKREDETKLPEAGTGDEAP